MPDKYEYLVAARPDVPSGPTHGMPVKSKREMLQDALNSYAQEGWRYMDITESSIIFERLQSPDILEEG